MDTPRVFDCFPFFNELDILEIRLAELDPLVDHFVIVEATRTHTGKPKPLYFADNRKRYDRYADKIIHVVVDDLPSGPSDHWGREIFQRQAIVRGLGDARPDDRIISSDCDEIPKPDVLRRALALPGLSHRIVVFWCENYFYRLNLRNDAHDHRFGAAPRDQEQSHVTQRRTGNSISVFQASLSETLCGAGGGHARREATWKIPLADNHVGRRMAFHLHGRFDRGQCEVRIGRPARR